ncbi:MAG TPA: CHAT domain-containing protein [Pyrinomonadaceae bacterium]|nr:CHAT domain-containing protein [Pyrinomonadaceae bacterium]
MMVSRRRAVIRLVLVWMLWLYPAFCLAAPTREQDSNQARQLLALSEKQNENNHSLALETARRALEISKSLNDELGAALALDQIAQCYFAQSDLVEATGTYQEALQLWREQGNLHQQIQTLNMLGFIDAEKGDWQSAISYLTQAQSVNTENDPDLMARSAAGLASVFVDSGLPNSALIHYQRAREFYRKADYARGVNRMTMMIGHTYFLLQNASAAEEHLQTALASFDPSGVDAAQCNEYLSQLRIAAAQYADALQHLLPVVKIYESAGNPKQAARVRALIGQLYEQQGNFAEARANYLEASETFRRISDRVSDAAVSFALGRLELEAGDYDAAEPFLKQSIEYTEFIRSKSIGRELKQAFSASVHARYAAYVECLMRKHAKQPSQGLDVMAFEASELARGRSLAELLHDTQTDLLNGVDAQTAEREKSLRQLIRAKEDYCVDLLATDYSKEDLDQLEASLARLRDEYKQVLDKIRIVNPSYERISQPSAYSLRQIQQQVINDDQTVLLEYLLGNNASYVWLVSKNGFASYEIPKEAIINEAVGKLYNLLSVKPTAESETKLRDAARELGQMVLGPVAGQLAGRRVIVVADGGLNYIPFQLLPLDRELLIEKVEVINTPSASILGQLRSERSKRQPADKVVAAFGDAVFPSNYVEYKESGSDQLVAKQKRLAQPAGSNSRDIDIAEDALNPEKIQPLFYARWELQNLRELLGSEAFLATGFDASREKLESADLSHYSILHLATHGILNTKNPEDSGFVLSLVDPNGKPQNGFITMKDVYRLHVPVVLVVISACRTGLGKEVKGEGLIGLTRGFMHAGASSVVSTLWRVDDEATAELMKHFYANMLQQGMTPAAALREAQNTIRQDPRWTSPYYWAAFTLQGEYKESIYVPLTTRAMVRRVGIELMVLMFLIGLGWWLWRWHAAR